MNRLLVALLAAFDALVAAAVGVAAALAPLAVLWVVGLGGGADWAALWPAAARLWQLGHLVPLVITLPAEYIAVTGIPADAAHFTVSLAPLAFAAFTAISGARSGARAARAGAGLTGVVAGAVVIAAVSVLLRLSSGNGVAAIFTWQAVLLPTLVFAVPALIAALVRAWRVGDDGLVDALRARLDTRPDWIAVPGAAARGIGIALAGFIGVGALLVAVATVVRGGEVVALFQAANVDAVGASVLALGQVAYLPTLVIWGGSFAAGPGFLVGAGTSVSPAGTSLGVVPGIPVLGILPESVSPWLLLTVLAVIAVGFLAGWAARDPLLGSRTSQRLAALSAIVVLGGAGAGLLAAMASGSIGPGRLQGVGPETGPVALAVGLELAVGAAIALFTPARRALPAAESAFFSPESAFLHDESAFLHDESAFRSPESAFAGPESARPHDEVALDAAETAPIVRDDDEDPQSSS